MARIGLTGLLGVAAAAIGLYGSGVPSSPPAEAAVTIPASATDAAEPGTEAVAILAGGCFWGLEGVYEHVAGVRSVTSGFAGGDASDADYDRVSGGGTRHAEVVRIVYNPRIISYAHLLRIFFSVAHDPTQLNRQGPDRGPQYRSAIFPQNAEQRRVAAAYVDQLGRARRFNGRIVTRIETGAFFPADEHHQNFMRRNPRHPYIVVNDAPKLRDFRATFPRLYTARPAP